MANVEFRNIGKSYGNTQIVKDFNLQIEDGEFIVLLGPSGCGKSTTLRMLAGLETISAGEIYIDNKLVNEVHAKDRDLAMVFQSYALYPHMTVYENISFALKLKGLKKELIDVEVQKAAKMLELSALLERRPKDLSGGQRQRVAMGRAMVRTPKVFLFDEPLSNLDAKLRGVMRDEIKQLHKTLKTTTIYVTHDQIEAMTLADRIVIIKEGDITQVGTPTEVFQSPANKFVAQFIGNPSMNLLDAKIIKQGGQWMIDVDNRCIPLPLRFTANVQEQQDVLLGIRPTDIYLRSAQIEHDRIVDIPVEIDDYELLGASVLLKTRLLEQPLLIESPAVEIDKTTTNVYINLDKIHLFDRLSELSLQNG
ncbi:sn-glycerol-3-phosphate ABC transporter ATP-binding protein UgpC [Vibrio sp. TH_r3]|uniref:ABC transporter ATP-binding protein n=1 Tax=unclassified Vibrio TaxID=2614977 RepID=UPI002953B79F|nr:sn-glycerol-3-phosphate ABC transporter ATP-binding protein UgpC [Vibrio sp. TH_r3]MDV7105591.1 sn-glycerol-3-phosphate ABC transporter ATP-binding protein UgpC [Vibrio sp. TH_r3]